MNKIIEAKYLELEAFTMLLPEPYQSHVKVIGKELKEMAGELAKSGHGKNLLSGIEAGILAACAKRMQKDGGEKKEEKNISKITIQ